MKNVLITGGSGASGRHLSNELKKKGYEVAWLGRNSLSKSEFHQYRWVPEENYIDPEAIKFADIIINLAGASIGDKRWTSSYKKLLYSSRIQTTRLLLDECLKQNKSLTAFISASAVGYYGYDRGDELLSEKATSGHDFLAHLCSDWENESEKFKKISDRVLTFRLAIILSEKSGILPRLEPLFKLNFGSVLGSGKQFFPWIHQEDVSSAILFSLENSLSGTFNLCAPETITNMRFTQSFALHLNKKILFPPVPPFMLKLGLGEMANSILGSLKVSSEKLINMGYQFKFPELDQAMNDLLSEE